MLELPAKPPAGIFFIVGCQVSKHEHVRQIARAHHRGPAKAAQRFLGQAACRLQQERHRGWSQTFKFAALCFVHARPDTIPCLYISICRMLLLLVQACVLTCVRSKHTEGVGEFGRRQHMHAQNAKRATKAMLA